MRPVTVAVLGAALCGALAYGEQGRRAHAARVAFEHACNSVGYLETFPNGIGGPRRGRGPPIDWAQSRRDADRELDAVRAHWGLTAPCPK